MRKCSKPIGSTPILIVEEGKEIIVETLITEKEIFTVIGSKNPEEGKMPSDKKIEESVEILAKLLGVD